MRRREFVYLLGGAMVPWPRTATAQQTAAPLIGYLSSKTSASETAIVAAAREGLAQHGFVEGRNLAITYGWSEVNYDRLPNLAAEFVRQKVRVIMTSGLPATLAAKAATSTIPIVFRLAVDPVAFGLTQNYDRPGGNLTGVTMLFDPLTPKKLQLLHELVPAAASIGFLINPKNQNAASHEAYVAAAAKELGLRVTVLAASSKDELEVAFASVRRQAIGALLVGDDPFLDARHDQLVRLAAQYAVPTMYAVRDFPAAGGLVSYGANFEEMARQAGDYAGRILKGAAPSELPIMQPTKIELVINLKTAKTLGIAIPPSLLASADEVIE